VLGKMVGLEPMLLEGFEVGEVLDAGASAQVP
jgi:hypothetical protein